MDYNMTLGISKERLGFFDFINISTTHLHLAGYTVKHKITEPKEASMLWLQRLYALLEKDLPWQKTGIAHLTCGHILKGRTAEVISLIETSEMYNIFSECAKKGVGIELNMKTIFTSDDEKNTLLRPYFIAKECGCKFYMGSDAHKVEALKSAKGNFENIVTLLDLKEEDKFLLGR
jgi:histidinol phosphatase-like PHP family hydrolase